MNKTCWNCGEEAIPIRATAQEFCPHCFTIMDVCLVVGMLLSFASVSAGCEKGWQA